MKVKAQLHRVRKHIIVGLKYIGGLKVKHRMGSCVQNTNLALAGYWHLSSAILSASNVGLVPRVSGPKSELCVCVAPPGDSSLMVPVCFLVM